MTRRKGWGDVSANASEEERDGVGQPQVPAAENLDDVPRQPALGEFKTITVDATETPWWVALGEDRLWIYNLENGRKVQAITHEDFAERMTVGQPPGGTFLGGDICGKRLALRMTDEDVPRLQTWMAQRAQVHVKATARLRNRSEWVVGLVLLVPSLPPMFPLDLATAAFGAAFLALYGVGRLRPSLTSIGLAALLHLTFAAKSFRDGLNGNTWAWVACAVFLFIGIGALRKLLFLGSVVRRSRSKNAPKRLDLAP